MILPSEHMNYICDSNCYIQKRKTDNTYSRTRKKQTELSNFWNNVSKHGAVRDRVRKAPGAYVDCNVNLILKQTNTQTKKGQKIDQYCICFHSYNYVRF